MLSPLNSYCFLDRVEDERNTILTHSLCDRETLALQIQGSKTKQQKCHVRKRELNTCWAETKVVAAILQERLLIIISHAFTFTTKCLNAKLSYACR